MMIPDDQIRKFLANRCSAEEAAQIAAYLEENPYLLEKWIPADELLKIQEPPADADPVPSGKLLQNIRRNAYAGKSKWIRMRQAAAVAAVIAVITIGGIRYMQNARISSTPVIATEQQRKNYPQDSWKTVLNNTSAPMHLELEDGSIAIVAPGSSLQYHQPFEGNRRFFVLKGTSFFKVIKDVKRPFSVTAEGYVTTVLGTSFQITAPAGHKDLRVELYSGKVSIDKADAGTSPSFPQIVLKPGQRATIDKSRSLATLTAIRPERQPAGHGADRQSEDDGYLVFHQAPLSSILHSLEKTYQITISFDPKEIDHLDFTGTFDKQESINSILQNLSGLYNLTLLKNDTGFTIKK